MTAQYEGEANARAQMETIREACEAWQTLIDARRNENEEIPVAFDGSTYEEAGDLQDAIHEFPLSVNFRSGWVASWSDMEIEEYRITLTTGGPECRIVGEIGEGDPALQWKDWGTGWQTLHVDPHTDDGRALAWFAGFFTDLMSG